jgi:predicted ABC-type exoprotein transport system permease subunit
MKVPASRRPKSRVKRLLPHSLLEFVISETTNFIAVYWAFHNVFRDYKHLEQENQRTYLNGIVHSHRKTGKDSFDN